MNWSLAAKVFGIIIGFALVVFAFIAVLEIVTNAFGGVWALVVFFVVMALVASLIIGYESGSHSRR